MKIRWAKNEQGETVDVLSLAEYPEQFTGPFHCINCSSELIPVLGKVRVSHFRHKVESEEFCNSESYLHALAKLLFVDGFKRAQAECRPYTVPIEEVHQCTKWQNSLNYTCELGREKHDFDLARLFDTVEIERGVSGFVADVLLSNSKTKETLLVEFCVSNECSPEKISSGLRIIEIKILSEERLDQLLDGLGNLGEATTLHNFAETNVEHSECMKQCNLIAELFVVDRCGHGQILRDAPEIVLPRSKSIDIVHRSSTRNIYEGDRLIAWGLDFENEASKAARQGVNVRACSICIHSSVVPARLRYICKLTNLRVGQSAAVECPHFQRSVGQ
jgi:competence protein CoiA-like protein